MIDVLAEAGLYGLDPERMLHGDSLDRGLRVKVVERARELRSELDDSLAVKIINTLSEAMRRGS